MLSFSNSPGSLFNRWGKAGLVLKQLKSYQSAQLTNLTDTTNGLVAQLNNESDIQALVGSNYLASLSSPETVGGTMRTAAAAIANRMVYRDNPQVGQTITTSNTLASLVEIIRQMNAAGATVLAMSVGATPTSFTGSGNGVVVCSVKRPSDGMVLENTFAETVTLTCSKDSYNGGAQAGNERFTVTGQGTQADFFAFNWPLGSNTNTSLSAINGAVNNSQGNILTNSGFDSFTSNTPANWTIVTGSAGSQVFQETTLVFDGASALRILGDGSTQTKLQQQFGVQTAGTLENLTQYSVNLFLRRDGVAGVGTLTVDLVDQNGTVLKDANNVANSFTVDLSTLGTGYAPFKAMFRTPMILPSQQFLRVYLTPGGYSNGRSFYIDKTSMGLATQLYLSGPFTGVHSGSVPFVQGDFASATFTNSRGAGGTLSTFQTLFAQLFTSQVYGNELLLPSSPTPSISDSLFS